MIEEGDKMKRKISVSLDYDVAKTIEAWSVESERSLSQCINLLLKKIIKEAKENPIPLS